MFLDFKRNVYFVCTHTMNVVSLVVGFYELLVFLYYTFLPTFLCLYFPLCTRRRHDMNIYDLIILRYVVPRLRKREFKSAAPLCHNIADNTRLIFSLLSTILK
jgi:hypothetical protein